MLKGLLGQNIPANSAVPKTRDKASRAWKVAEGEEEECGTSFLSTRLSTGDVRGALEEKLMKRMCHGFLDSQASNRAEMIGSQQIIS